MEEVGTSSDGDFALLRGLVRKVRGAVEETAVSMLMVGTGTAAALVMVRQPVCNELGFLVSCSEMDGVQGR